MYCLFLLFFSPILWKAKLLCVWKKLGPVGVHTVFTHYVLQTGTQPWPRRILEKDGKDQTSLMHGLRLLFHSMLSRWNAPDMFKMLSWQKIKILCHASVAWRTPGVVFSLSTSLTKYIWAWLVSFSPFSSETSMIVVLSTPRWHRQFLLFHSQSTHCIQERNFHLGLTGKDLDFVDVVGCLLLLKCN